MEYVGSGGVHILYEHVFTLLTLLKLQSMHCSCIVFAYVYICTLHIG